MSKQLFLKYRQMFYNYRKQLCISLRFGLNRNIEIGNNCNIDSKAKLSIHNGGSIKIGNNSELLPYSMLMTYGGNIEIGQHCSINPFAIIYGHGNVKIGNYVLVAGGTMIIPNNHVFKDKNVPIAMQGNDKKGIIIEDDVWIGHGCSILDGIRIGKGAVIAAGSVVNNDVEPYSVVGGIPALLIKNRE